MTDDDVRHVCYAVESYIERNNFDVGVPGNFDSLVDHVSLRLRHILNGDELRLVAAMCYLGRDLPNIPPASMRDELLHLLRTHVEDPVERKDRAMEFAIAYGCGWSRTPGNPNTWEGIWDNAVLGLVRALEPAVRKADRWLRTNVVGYEAHKNLDGLLGDTGMLAMRLVRPVWKVDCGRSDRISIETDMGVTQIASPQQPNHFVELKPGGKRVLSILSGTPAVHISGREPLPLPAVTTLFVSALDNSTALVARGNNQVFRAKLRAGDKANIKSDCEFAVGFWYCTCGTARCPQRHRLGAWQPGLQLWSFVASAVKGPYQPISTGSFAQGMYYGLLAEVDA